MKNLKCNMVKKFGEKKQLLKYVEETTELSDLILKYVNKDEKNRTETIKEYVDLLFTLDYIKIVFNITDEEIKIIESQNYEKIKKILK